MTDVTKADIHMKPTYVSNPKNNTIVAIIIGGFIILTSIGVTSGTTPQTNAIPEDNRVAIVNTATISTGNVVASENSRNSLNSAQATSGDSLEKNQAIINEPLKQVHIDFDYSKMSKEDQAEIRSLLSSAMSGTINIDDALKAKLEALFIKNGGSINDFQKIPGFSGAYREYMSYYYDDVIATIIAGAVVRSNKLNNLETELLNLGYMSKSRFEQNQKHLVTLASEGVMYSSNGTAVKFDLKKALAMRLGIDERYNKLDLLLYGKVQATHSSSVTALYDGYLEQQYSEECLKIHGPSTIRDYGSGRGSACVCNKGYELGLANVDGQQSSWCYPVY